MGVEDKLSERLDHIEARLLRLEARLTENIQAEAPVPPRSEVLVRDSGAHEVSTEDVSDARYESKSNNFLRPGAILGLASIICFVVAAGFILKLTIESGWLTPIRQLGLAVGLGTVLIGAGLWLRRVDKAYAAILPAAGIIIYYVSAFTTYLYFHLLAFEPTLGVCAGVSIICLGLYRITRHDVYAYVACVGSYLAPVILGFLKPEIFSLYYWVACSLAFAVLSIVLKTRAMGVVAAFLAISLTGAHSYLFVSETALVASLLGVQFVLFALTIFVFSLIVKKPLDTGSALSLGMVLLLFYLFEYPLIDKLYPTVAPYWALVSALGLLGLYFIGSRQSQSDEATRGVVMAYATLCGVHAAILLFQPSQWQWVLPVLLCFYAVFGKSEALRARPSNFIPIATALTICLWNYAILCTDLINFDAKAGMGIERIGMVFMTLTTMWLAILRAKQVRAIFYILHVSAHFLAVLTLYHIAYALGSLAISGAWLFYGVVVMAIGVWRKDKYLANSALVVLMIAAAKALLYDAASAPTIIRIVCLLLTGIVLYGCGLVIRRVASWDTP